MAKKYSLEKGMTKGEWGSLIRFFVAGLFMIGLLYLLEYTVNVGMTFQLDREEKLLTKINEEVDNLRIKTIGLSKYNRIATESSRLKSGNISLEETDSSKNLKAKPTPVEQKSSGKKLKQEIQPAKLSVSPVKNSKVESKSNKTKN